MKLLMFTGEYDNPATMQREWWWKGQKVATISACVIMQKIFPRDSPVWCPGKVHK